MSHASGTVIVALMRTGEFNLEDRNTLQEIADKHESRCSFWDALTVARILFRRLRAP